MAIREFRGTEVFNKVLNASGDALRVDLDNATITAGNILVALDYTGDSITNYFNTVKDGSGTGYIPIVDSDGHLQIDVLTSPGSSTLYEDDVHSSGEAGTMSLGVRKDTAVALAGTDGDYIPFIMDANGRLHVIEPSLVGILSDTTSIDSGITALDVTMTSVETKITTSNTKLTSIDTLLGTIDTDTGAMVVDLAAIEVLNTTNNSLLTTIDSVLDNILLDTAAIQTAVELIDNAISGSEMQVDIIASLPSGTNAIGKLAANSGVDIGDVDILSSALPTGASTSAKQDTAQTALDAIKTAVELLDNVVSGTEAQVDVVSSVLPSGAATSANQSTAQTTLTAIEGHLEKLYYDYATVITPNDAGDVAGAPYYMLYIGIAGDVALDLNGTGTNIVFKNLQSGQMLPVMFDRVYATNTTASNIVGLK